MEYARLVMGSDEGQQTPTASGAAEKTFTFTNRGARVLRAERIVIPSYLVNCQVTQLTCNDQNLLPGNKAVPCEVFFENSIDAGITFPEIAQNGFYTVKIKNNSGVDQTCELALVVGVKGDAGFQALSDSAERQHGLK